MEKLLFPAVAEETLSCLNRFFSRDRQISFELFQGAFSLAFVPSPTDYQPVVFMKFRAGSNIYFLSLGTDLLSPLMEDLLSDVSLSDLPPDIRLAVLETGLEDLLSRFEQWSGWETGIESSTGDSVLPDSGRLSVHFALVSRKDRSKVMGSIVGDARSMHEFAEILEETSWLSGSHWESIPCGARVVVGKTVLTYAELNSLEQHDIILPEPPLYLSAERLRFYVSPTLYCTGHFEGGSVTIMEGFIMDTSLDEEREEEEGVDTGSESVEEQEGEQSAAVSAPDRDETAPSLDELELEVVFEVGRKKLLLGDLRNIQPGYVFQLDTEMEQPVKMRVNGKQIGVGELVKIETKLGVRILELFTSGNDSTT